MFFYNLQNYLADVAECDVKCDTACDVETGSSLATISNTPEERKIPKHVLMKGSTHFLPTPKQSHVLEATMMMSRVQIMNGKRGIHFVGTPITVQIALGVGSILGFCIFNVAFVLLPTAGF
jgi:hypothetical protein